MFLPASEVLDDGSWRSVLRGSGRDRRRSRGELPVRVVAYRTGDGGESFMLATTLMDHRLAPAAELAALYHERWEIENACDEVGTHILGKGAALRSKTPALARQEIDGLMLAHYAVRCLIHEAAEKSGEDADRLSFTHAVNVMRRRIINPGASPPGGPGARHRGRDPRGARGLQPRPGQAPGGSGGKCAVSISASVVRCHARSTTGLRKSSRNVLEATVWRLTQCEFLANHGDDAHGQAGPRLRDRVDVHRWRVCRPRRPCRQVRPHGTGAARAAGSPSRRSRGLQAQSVARTPDHVARADAASQRRPGHQIGLRDGWRHALGTGAWPVAIRSCVYSARQSAKLVADQAKRMAAA